MVLFSLLLLTTLTGCFGRHYADAKVKELQFVQGNKAIIITRAAHSYKGLIFNGEVDAAYEFAKADSNYPDLKTRYSYRPPSGDMQLFGLGGKQYDFLMVDPGTYVLENISYTMGDTKYFSILDGLNPGTEHFTYGGFTVKAGEIVYLGNMDIDLNVRNNTSHITTGDDYDNAVKAFLKKHPEFSTHPIRKKFLETRGTLLKQSHS